MNTVFRSLPLAFLILCSAGVSAQAQLQWDGNTGSAGVQDGAGSWGASNRWHTGSGNTNWTNNSPVTLGAGGSGSAIITLDLSVSVPSLTTLAGTAYTITPAASQTITLTGASAGFAIAKDLKINSVLTGAANLVKSGAGALTLAAANSFNGSVAVQEGVLKLDHVTALNNRPLDVQPGATARLNIGGTFTTGAAWNADGTIDFSSSSVASRLRITGPLSGGGVFLLGYANVTEANAESRGPWIENGAATLISQDLLSSVSTNATMMLGVRGPGTVATFDGGWTPLVSPNSSRNYLFLRDQAALVIGPNARINNNQSDLINARVFKANGDGTTSHIFAEVEGVGDEVWPAGRGGADGGAGEGGVVPLRLGEVVADPYVVAEPHARRGDGGEDADFCASDFEGETEPGAVVEHEPRRGE